MLTPLGTALGGWKPGGSAPADPFGAIASTWAEIVGPDVAQHAHPLERAGDALVVLVSSSAWSNQLQLLSPQVLRALRAQGVEGIERLRFRVGRPRRPPAAKGRAADAPGTASRPERLPPSASTEEAFERLRSRIGGFRAARIAQGWATCGGCGAVLPDGRRCASCATGSQGERAARIQRLMYEAPWLGFRDTAALVDGLTRDEYEANRLALLGRWRDELERAKRLGSLSRDGRERRIASSYLLLKTGWEPDRITPEIAKNEFGDALAALLYEAHTPPPP